MRFVLCLLFCVVLFSSSACLGRGFNRDVSDVVKEAGYSDDRIGPKYSDVCMSSRWHRPLNADDPHDTLRDAAAFHATRLEWCYSFDSDWIKKVKDAGYFYGGTLNANLADQWPSEPEELTYITGRICDVKGNSITAPWMNKWTPIPYWGCVNSPEYRKIYLECVKKLIEDGADSIQMDDPASNLAALNWGGCFCQHCVAKAALKFVELKDDAQRREFTKQSIQEFYEDIRRSIEKLSGGTVALSCNNFRGRFGFPVEMFDYGMAEYDEPEPQSLLAIAKYARSLGKWQTITYRTKSTIAYRRTISLCYAVGLGILCPYDVYLKSTPEGSERLFIKPEKVADIYGFVRANAEYLDGYEDAAVDGEGLEEERYRGDKPLSVLYKGVYGFVRASGAGSGEPVVVHLVDWIGAKRPFTIELNNANFFGGKPFEAKLLMPTAYDKGVHELAEKTKDYSLLSSQIIPTQTRDKDITTVSIPPINPYAIVVLTPILESAE